MLLKKDRMSFLRKQRRRTASAARDQVTAVQTRRQLMLRLTNRDALASHSRRRRRHRKGCHPPLSFITSLLKKAGRKGETTCRETLDRRFKSSDCSSRRPHQFAAPRPSSPWTRTTAATSPATATLPTLHWRQAPTRLLLHPPPPPATRLSRRRHLRSSVKGERV